MSNCQPTASALKGAIQLGIGYAVGNLSSKPDRDVLMQDFSVVESVFLPRYTSPFLQLIWFHLIVFPLLTVNAPEIRKLRFGVCTVGGLHEEKKNLLPA